MKIALIGSRGHIGYVFGGLFRVPGVEIAAISSGCGDSPENVLAMCREKGHSPAVYADWRQMIDEVKPVLVCVDGPFDRHAEMAAEVLKKNIHVFCEKPIALDFEQLQMIRKAWQTSGKHIRSMVGLRYDAAFLHAYRLVKDGAVGKIKFIRTQKSYKLGQRPDFYKTRATYGGTIPWVGSHALDWIIFYTGAEFECVTAYHDAGDNNGHGDLEVACHCLFRMKNGIIADAGIDYLRPAEADGHGDDRVRIAGTDGVLEVIAGKVHLINRDGDRFIEPPEADRDVFSDFVLELSGNRPSLVTDEETFALAEAVIMARDSADCGKTLFFK
jgi:predicted dehydrogenase